MLESEDIIRRRCEMFESYCKTVLRNYARDLERAARRREEREILTSTPMEFAQLEADEEERNIILCLGVPCVIIDETLYIALLSLSERQRNVILCGNWLNMTNEKIADIYSVTTRTIYNWRKSAIQRIKNAYEKEAAFEV